MNTRRGITEVPGKIHFDLFPYFHLQHAPAEHELVLFDTNEITPTTQPNETMIVTRWNYKAATVTRTDSRIIDLFDRTPNQLRPRAALPIK